jgi:hypothetical protein
MPRIPKFPIETPLRLAEEHRDFELLIRLEAAIYRQAGGEYQFKERIPNLLRQAVDEVIDTRRSGRFVLAELQNSEKTYIGTKVEIVVRSYLKLPRGTLLDVVIDGVETDIKNTIGTSWMIPKEAVGHPCILIRTDEKRSKCWFGLIVAHGEVLNPGGNQDLKTTIAAMHFSNVLWMLYAHDYPRNFWEDVAPKFRNELMRMVSANARVVAFFKQYMETPISRHVLEGLIAPQLDPMKRLRKNGGARDQLCREGIALLSGTYNAKIIAAMGLPFCKADQWISFAPRTDKQRELLRQHECID